MTITSPTLPSFDIGEIPYSVRGSWLNLSPVVALHTTAHDIHLVSHVSGMHAPLALIPSRAGTRVDTVITADPSLLVWDCGDGATVRATFESTSVLRLTGDRAELQIADASDGLTPFTGSYFYKDPTDGSYVFTSYESGRRYRVSVLRGTVAVEGAEALGVSTRRITVGGVEGWEIAIEEYEAARTPYASLESFSGVVERVAHDFDRYLEAIAGWRTDGTPAAALAVYVLWSATVEPAGFLRRESILMSKHWMDKVWSWDHCFNALAVAPGLADMALDQFLTPFDHQDASGAMPDSVTHSEILYNFVKPPIHGWALAKLRSRLPRELTTDELSEIHERLARWSRFWLDYRTVSGRELPHYQHGNDSGWDNSTTFDQDRLIESPDLAAFLVVQLDELASLADELGREGSAVWRAERDRVQAALLQQLWDEDGFFAVGALSGRASKRTSLLNQLPVLAADRFPAEVGRTLAGRIGAHLTTWGPATQLVNTPEYEDDGYWRGPIWAPSTMLIEDGLRRGGFVELADTVSERFRALCERSGFAENFDARTGEGLRDRAYTWTASVYLVLAHEWVTRDAG
jgi:glycogen debranching enzyme